MTHTIEITEERRQMILLAMAQLSMERPGWHWTLGETAKCFPGGAEMFERFRAAHSDRLPVSNVAEVCAKIVETWKSEFEFDEKLAGKIDDIASEIRRYAADLNRPENVGANREI